MVEKAPLKFTEQSITMSARHKFSPAEMDRLQKKIAKDVQALRELEAEKTEAMADFNAQVKEKKGEVNVGAHLVNQGYEYRSMECKAIFSWGTGIKTVIHPETGEVILEEKITPQERQTLIDIEGRKK